MIHITALFAALPPWARLLAVALALCGCGSSPQVAPSHDAGADVLAVDAPPESTALDAAPDVALDAGPDVGGGVTCMALGGSCEASSDCWCGTAAGCGGYDNVMCSDAGRCALEYAWPDAGSPLDCCEACERDFQLGDAGLSNWRTCAAACGAGQCPIRCLGQ